MSTYQAIVDIVNSIQRNMDNKLFPCSIFLAFKKAFDTEGYSILLSNIYHYGIRGPVNDWFSSYLNSRVQTTQIDNQISSITIYMKNFLHSDWLRAVQFFFKQCRKDLIQCKNWKQTKHSDWLMIKETQRWPIKSFAFKSSARPGWCN